MTVRRRLVGEIVIFPITVFIFISLYKLLLIGLFSGNAI